MKTFDATSQPKTNIIKIKPTKNIALKVIDIDPEPTARNTLERIESDKSRPGADGLKVIKFCLIFLSHLPFPFRLSTTRFLLHDGADDTEHSSIKHVIPGNADTLSLYPLPNKDPNKGSTGEVNKPAEEQ